jgi:hypothetical protein
VKLWSSVEGMWRRCGNVESAGTAPALFDQQVAASPLRGRAESGRSRKAISYSTFRVSAVENVNVRPRANI